MAVAHTKALKAWVEGDPDLAGIVFVGNVEGKAPTRYVLLFPQTPEHDVTRFAGRQEPLLIRHTAHSIGMTPAEAQWVADRLEARLVNAIVPVPGYDSKRVRHDGGMPMRVDTTVPPAVYFLADDYVWESTRIGPVQ